MTSSEPVEPGVGKIDVRVTWDLIANASSITLTGDLLPRPGERIDVPVENKRGSLIAVLHFHPDGYLCEVELLNARKQLPQSLKDIALIADRLADDEPGGHAPTAG